VTTLTPQDGTISINDTLITNTLSNGYSEVLLPDLSDFNPVVNNTLADDWLTISENALQDDVALSQLVIMMGGGFNYISTIPIESSTMVIPIANIDASVLITASPSLPSYVSYTIVTWPYVDPAPLQPTTLNVQGDIYDSYTGLNDTDIDDDGSSYYDINETSIIYNVTYDDSYDYNTTTDLTSQSDTSTIESTYLLTLPIISALNLGAAKLTWLGHQTSVSLINVDPVLDILNTPITATSLLPRGVTLAQLVDFTSVFAEATTLIDTNTPYAYTVNGTTTELNITMTTLSLMMSDYISDIIEVGSLTQNGIGVDTDYPTVSVTPLLQRQGTNLGYVTRFDFGVSIGNNKLYKNIMSTPSSALAGLFSGLNVEVIQGFDVYMDSAVTLNFTVIMTDTLDVRLEVRQLCIETAAG
jgi:hypothetical protein